MSYVNLLKKIPLLFGLLLSVSTQPLYAQMEEEKSENNHERWYQVEMIVFARAESNAQETWPNDLKLSYPTNLITLKSDNPASEGFIPLSPNERLLNTQAATLAKSGTYTVLFHQAWRQIILSHKTNIFINGGKTYNGHQELEGSIALNVAQYLKIQTNLWLTQFVPSGTQVTETWPELPIPPGATINDTEKTQDYVIKRIAKISEQRTMRSNEVHYLDHSLLGVIVKIIPYDMPH